MTRMPARSEIDVTERAAAEGARRATGDAALSVRRAPRDPDPEVPAKARRRRFPAAYRLRILKQADACKKAGDVGALLRREGLYSSRLTNWRRQRDQGALVSMRARKRGPTGRSIDPRVKQLEAENAAAAEAAAGGHDHQPPKKRSGAAGAALPVRPETPNAAIVAVPREEWPFTFW